MLEEHLLLMFMCTVDASWSIGGRTKAYQVVVSESNHYSALQLVNHIQDQKRNGAENKIEIHILYPRISL